MIHCVQTIVNLWLKIFFVKYIIVNFLCIRQHRYCTTTGGRDVIILVSHDLLHFHNSVCVILLFYANVLHKVWYTLHTICPAGLVIKQ